MPFLALLLISLLLGLRCADTDVLLTLVGCCGGCGDAGNLRADRIAAHFANIVALPLLLGSASPFRSTSHRVAVGRTTCCSRA